MSDTGPFSIQFPFPIITPRLLIRPPILSDSLAVNTAILESYEVLHQFMDWAKEKPTLKETEQYIREALANWILKKNDEPYLPLFLFDKASGLFVGASGYHHYNWEVPCLETGYWIRSSHTGLGLMTEAINALTQYAFKQLQVKRIAITCDVNNFRSKKIPERLNYTLEGILKANRINPISGNISDTLVYAKYTLDKLQPLLVNWE
jgi:ribosomal-protein-serine acetyltransferase